MNPDRHQQIEKLFHAARERSPDSREAYLAAHCAGDVNLQTEVLSLLKALERADGFLERPASPTATRAASALADPVASAAMAAREGQRIGPWLLGGRIAVGGMADVYRATRADGQYQQDVAIKLIRRGIETDAALRRHIISRFRDERQHMANLDHPFIARLVDGGTTNDDLPYLVMEYIPGLPITRYCEEHGLSIKQRLQLVRDVCSAVDHAHGKFVAHRDLKPSNILVVPGPQGKGQPVPKLLDFGIAKLLKDEGLREPSARTNLGLQAMTPEYASPEQVCGGEVTAATDIYSLGVILYELVTGKLPYQLTQYDAKTVICEQTPPKPSAIRHSINREVDAIILKALEKDPARRYSSAAALADDIHRYLTDRPIAARPPTVTYLLGRFLARHGSRVASAVFLLLAISATTALLLTLSSQAQSQARQADELNRANRLYAIAANVEARGDYVDAEGLLREAIDLERKNSPDVMMRAVHAAELTLLGRALVKQEKYQEAEGILRESLGIWNAAVAPKGHSRMAEAQHLLGICLIQQGRAGEAEPLLRESGATFLAMFGPAATQTRQVYLDLAALYDDLGRPAEAAECRTRVTEAEAPDADPPASAPAAGYP